MERYSLAWLVQPDLIDLMLREADRRLVATFTEVIWWKEAQPPTDNEVREALTHFAEPKFFSGPSARWSKI